MLHDNIMFDKLYPRGNIRIIAQIVFHYNFLKDFFDLENSIYIIVRVEN